MFHKAQTGIYMVPGQVCSGCHGGSGHVSRAVYLICEGGVIHGDDRICIDRDKGCEAGSNIWLV